MKNSARIAMNKLRRIDADMLTVYELVLENAGDGDINKEYWPTMKTFASRLAESCEEVELELHQREQDELDAKRWQFLFHPAVSFKQVGGNWMVYFRKDAKTIKLMDQGSDLIEIVDRQLNKGW